MKRLSDPILNFIFKFTYFLSFLRFMPFFLMLTIRSFASILFLQRKEICEPNLTWPKIPSKQLLLQLLGNGLKNITNDMIHVLCGFQAVCAFCQLLCIDAFARSLKHDRRKMFLVSVKAWMLWMLYCMILPFLFRLKL